VAARLALIDTGHPGQTVSLVLESVGLILTLSIS
jgi:hypothetical protein